MSKHIDSPADHFNTKDLKGMIWDINHQAEKMHSIASKSRTALQEAREMMNAFPEKPMGKRAETWHKFTSTLEHHLLITCQAPAKIASRRARMIALAKMYDGYCDGNQMKQYRPEAKRLMLLQKECVGYHEQLVAAVDTFFESEAIFAMREWYFKSAGPTLRRIDRNLKAAGHEGVYP